MQADLLLVFCVVILLFVALIGRLLYIDEKDGERYEKRVLSQQTYMSNAIPYKRGSIVDRNDTVFAKSEKIYNLVLDPVNLLEKEEYKAPTIQAITSSFDIAAGDIEKALAEKADKRYVVIKKGLEYDPVEAFKALKEKNKNIQGVWFEEDYRRVYPLKTVAGDVIGFTNSRGEAGIGGIEGYYNNELTGSEGREYGYFDADLNLERTVKPAVDGNTIVTTLDANVQSIVEKHIAKFNRETGSKTTGVVVMNPQNGEIYAMASGDSYDLNNPWDLSGYFTDEEIDKMTEEEKSDFLNKLWRNFCISDAYEPGSTFKPVTVAAALEENKTSEKSNYVCDGKEVILGQPINCNKTSGHGNLRLEQTLMLSCNDAMMQIAADMGRKTFYKYHTLFNFGSKTGIDLPGETTGGIFTEDRLDPIELATSSFGQGFTCNMLQISGAISSLINGGYYYEPHVVKSIRNENGATVQSMDPVLVRRTVSAHTSELIKKFMYETVDSGTGKKAQVPGYEIGGKTGTAQKFPRDAKKYLVSFIGFAPVEAPKVVVYVVVDEPAVVKPARQDDSSYAQYLSRDIMQEILPFLGVYPAEDAGSPAENDNNAEDGVQGGDTAPQHTDEPSGDQDAKPEEDDPEGDNPNEDNQGGDASPEDGEVRILEGGKLADIPADEDGGTGR